MDGLKQPMLRNTLTLIFPPARRSIQLPLCSPNTNMLPTIALLTSVIFLSVNPMTLSTSTNLKLRGKRIARREAGKALKPSKQQKAQRYGCSNFKPSSNIQREKIMFTFSDKSGEPAVPWLPMRFPPNFLRKMSIFCTSRCLILSGATSDCTW